MAPRRKCIVCGSRQWHKEPATGLVICSEGHVLQNYRNETNETQGLGPHMMRKRQLKSGRRRREWESRADPKLYHGARAEYLYFQSLQLLLRKQVVALTRAWDLPPEFEVICRDIWPLHLSLLPAPPPAEPLLHQQDVTGPDALRTKPSEVSLPAVDDGDSGDDSHPEKPPNSETSSFSSSSSDSDADEEVSEINELLRGLSDSSSSSSDEGEEKSGKAHPKPDSDGQRRKRGRDARESHDGPASNIAVLMVACWTLRLPVMYMDLVGLIEAHGLPYLDSTRHLPADMVLHLPKNVAKALSPPHAPAPLLLHGLSARLARKFRAAHGIHTPELNAAPMLWRAVRALGGTPVLYDLAKTIAQVVSVPLTLHHTLAPNLPQIHEQDPESHQYDNVPPEVAFLAVVIVVLKMVYGLDGRIRVPTERADPACALPRMKEYLAWIKQLKKEQGKKNTSLFSARTDMPTADLSDAQLDEYLDFCETALLGPKVQQLNRKVIDDYFPLEPRRISRESGSVRSAPEERVMRAGLPQEAGSDTLEPGDIYRIYNSRDSFGALPEAYEEVIGRGAQWAGIAEEFLLGVTERYERRLVRWWEKLRLREIREAKRRLEGTVEEVEEDEE